MTKDEIILELNVVDDNIEDLHECIEDARDNINWYMQRKQDLEEKLSKLEEEDDDD